MVEKLLGFLLGFKRICQVSLLPSAIYWGILNKDLGTYNIPILRLVDTFFLSVELNTVSKIRASNSFNLQTVPIFKGSSPYYNFIGPLAREREFHMLCLHMNNFS